MEISQSRGSVELASGMASPNQGAGWRGLQCSDLKEDRDASTIQLIPPLHEFSNFLLHNVVSNVLIA